MIKYDFIKFRVTIEMKGFYENYIYFTLITSQNYKKCSPGKYALLLNLAISIRWISVMFDACPQLILNNLPLMLILAIFLILINLNKVC